MMLRAERMAAIRLGAASNQTAETLCHGISPIFHAKLVIVLPSFDRKVHSYFWLGRFEPAITTGGSRMRTIMTALAFCAMATTGAMAADVTPSSGSCQMMADQVKTALDAHQDSANVAQATKEKNFGRDFCNESMYKVGLQHYAEALKLLGVSAS
jgi:hypothetical protein